LETFVVRIEKEDAIYIGSLQDLEKIDAKTAHIFEKKKKENFKYIKIGQSEDDSVEATSLSKSTEEDEGITAAKCFLDNTNNTRS
jgi:hypothetical protein